MIVEFFAPSEAEFQDAFDWYDERSPRSAERFRAAVADAVRRAVERPSSAGFLVGRRVRKIVLKPFDYGVIYFVRGSRLYVVAIARNKRRPTYWATRVARI